MIALRVAALNVIAGFLLIVAGSAWLWGPLALVAAGVVLVLAGLFTDIRR